jgi:hypothetical protein
MIVSSIVIIVAIAAVLVWRSDKSRVEKVGAPEDASVAAATGEAAAPQGGVEDTSLGTSHSRAELGFDVLEGRWLRPDGGYIVHIAGVAPDGTIDAAYYNPRPIRVSRARATRVDGAIHVFVELNDVGYPFCTYDLEYDPANDRLAGVYVQTAIQQSFDVVFVRAR